MTIFSKHPNSNERIEERVKILSSDVKSYSKIVFDGHSSNLKIANSRKGKLLSKMTSSSDCIHLPLGFITTFSLTKPQCYNRKIPSETIKFTATFLYLKPRLHYYS